MKRTLVRKMNGRRSEIKSAKQKMVECIFLSPRREFSLTELAGAAGISKSSASRVIVSLEKEGLAQVDRRKILWTIRADVSNPKYQAEKIPYNLRTVLRSGVVELLEEEFNHPRAIVLFGSMRGGDDVEDSDIDIAIETNEPVEMHEAAVDGLKPLEKRLSKRISVHVFNRKNVDLNVFNNIANGIVLHGFLEVKV